MELCQPDYAGPRSLAQKMRAACVQPSGGQPRTAEESGSGVAGTGTPLLGDHLEEFFCVEQFTGWEGKFRLNLPGDLVRHIEPHVGRQRIPPVQERLDERKLLWSKPLRSEGGCGRSEERRVGKECRSR